MCAAFGVSSGSGRAWCQQKGICSGAEPGDGQCRPKRLPSAHKRPQAPRARQARHPPCTSLPCQAEKGRSRPLSTRTESCVHSSPGHNGETEQHVRMAAWRPDSMCTRQPRDQTACVHDGFETKRRVCTTALRPKRAARGGGLFEAVVAFRSILFVTNLLQDNCLLEGGRLAGHGTINMMGPPHRSDVWSMGKEQYLVVDLLKLWSS